MSGNKSKLDQYRQTMAASALTVAAPGTKAKPFLTTPTVVTIPVAEIEPYERNPRTDPNEAYEDIKESIRVSGLDSIMQVTRLPGAAHYTVAKGGNTRLKALKELWDETKDPKFESVACQIFEWKDHASAIADHVKENTVRGAMSFFDKAKACLDIRNEIASTTGQTPGVRELVKTLRGTYGLTIDQPTLGRYLHVAEHFAVLKPWVNNPISKSLIPPFNSLVRLAEKWDKNENETHQELQAALERYAFSLGDDQEFNSDAAIAGMEAAVAVALGLTQHQLQYALAGLAVSPNATKAELLTSPQAQQRLDQIGGGGAGDADDATPPLPPNTVGSGSNPGQNESVPGLDATRRQAGSGAKTPAQIALELGAQTRAQRERELLSGASDPGTGAGTTPPATPPTTTGAPAGTGSKKALSVEGALDVVIDAAATFADLCGVSELCHTSLSLPVGFFMEIDEEGTTSPTADCADARIRVGGWWLAATLTRQWDEDQARLLPTSALWRKFWVQEERDKQGAADPGEVFHVAQALLGGNLGNDMRLAVPLEYVHVVLADPQRAAAFSALVASVNQLQALRNGG
jgi:ParB family protein of integrating conjugative element (PFGI_1 class)